MIKLVVFDWDGTLMNSVARIVSSMQSAANEILSAFPSDEACRNIIGLSLPQAIHSLFPEQPTEIQNLIAQRYSQNYIELDPTPAPLFDNVHWMLESLKAQGMLLAVATGKSRQGLERVWQETDTKKYFISSRCACEARSKPDPQMLNDLIAELAIEPEQALMVGDTSYDLEMATNAGVKCIGVSMGVHSEEVLRRHNPLAIAHDIKHLHHLIVG